TENLLKLCLFLLCMEIAVALECLQCSGYKNGICEHKIKQCIAKKGESCMITRLWTWPHNEMAKTDCLKDCKDSEDDHGYHSVLIYCCTWHDFCNDICVPIESLF
uniref:UPAR/Ly6 domain-containing protein n=1 Tax=Marmota marmota marmota TaxID=9994 RepID=A0A8C6EMR6_MARMA